MKCPETIEDQDGGSRAQAILAIESVSWSSKNVLRKKSFPTVPSKAIKAEY